jgi:hypothetical protein
VNGVEMTDGKGAAPSAPPCRFQRLDYERTVKLLRSWLGFSVLACLGHEGEEAHQGVLTLAESSEGTTAFKVGAFTARLDRAFFDEALHEPGLPMVIVYGEDLRSTWSVTPGEVGGAAA